MEEFFEWAQSVGIRWDKVKYPVWFPHGIAGTVCTETIEPGESIVTVPDAALFSYYKIINGPLRPVLEAEDFAPKESLCEDFVMATGLVYERWRGPASPWYCFIHSLPEAPENLSDWTAEERQWLQDLDCEYDLSCGDREELEAFHCWKETLQRHPAFFSEAMLELVQFKWAWRLLSTRSFAKSECSACMVPVADLLNHANVSTVHSYKNSWELNDFPKAKKSSCEDDDDEWNDFEPVTEFMCADLVQHRKSQLTSLDSALLVEAEAIDYSCQEEKPDLPSLEHSDKEFRIVAGEPGYQPGQEVFLKYGSYSNRQLLVNFGFSLADNCYNYTRLKVQLENINGPPVLAAFKLKEQGLHKKLMMIIRGLHWTPDLHRDAFFSPADARLEETVLTRYLGLMQEKLASYATTIEEDERELPSASAPRLYFALFYRLGQKRILAKHIDFCEYALQIVGRMVQGLTVKEALEGLPHNDVRTSLKLYIKSLKIYST